MPGEGGRLPAKAQMSGGSVLAPPESIGRSIDFWVLYVGQPSTRIAPKSAESWSSCLAPASPGSTTASRMSSGRREEPVRLGQQLVVG